jgi:hypothetical protein
VEVIGIHDPENTNISKKTIEEIFDMKIYKSFYCIYVIRNPRQTWNTTLKKT